MYRETKELPTTVSPIRTGKWHELAEAIRLGCKKVPKQAFGRLVAVDSSASVDATCVVQAGADGGYNPETAFMVRADCPVCVKPTPQKILPHLNDFHCWTRERIADWLDTL
jgi:hypothetical protein